MLETFSFFFLLTSTFSSWDTFFTMKLKKREGEYICKRLFGTNYMACQSGLQQQWKDPQNFIRQIFLGGGKRGIECIWNCDCFFSYELFFAAISFLEIIKKTKWWRKRTLLCSWKKFFLFIRYKRITFRMCLYIKSLSFFFCLKK